MLTLKKQMHVMWGRQAIARRGRRCISRRLLQFFLVSLSAYIGGKSIPRFLGQASLPIRCLTCTHREPEVEHLPRERDFAPGRCARAADPSRPLPIRIR